MKRTIVMIIACAALGAAAAAATAGSPPEQAAPTRAEIQQKALAEGPATMQPGYLTHRDPVTRHPAGQVNPKLLRPLTQREVGMLFHACSAYPECVAAYGQARDRYDAQVRAKAAAEQ